MELVAVPTRTGSHSHPIRADAARARPQACLGFPPLAATFMLVSACPCPTPPHVASSKLVKSRARMRFIIFRREASLSESHAASSPRSPPAPPRV